MRRRLLFCAAVLFAALIVVLATYRLSAADSFGVGFVAGGDADSVGECGKR